MTSACYPCRKFPLNYNKSLHFHGGDTGSIPVRDASIFTICVSHPGIKLLAMSLPNSSGHSARCIRAKRNVKSTAATLIGYLQRPSRLRNSNSTLCYSAPSASVTEIILGPLSKLSNLNPRSNVTRTVTLACLNDAVKTFILISYEHRV